MASIIWPVSLPQNALVAGFNERPGVSVQASRFPRGPSPVRRTRTDAPRPITASYRMTAAQLATFRTFFEDTSFHGALMFDWPHPDAGTVEVRFRPDQPFTIAARGPTKSTVNLNLDWLV